MVFKKIIFQNRYVALETPRDHPPPFMANAILNFHFDYPHPSLIEFSEGSDEEERGDVGGDKRHNHCARLTHDKVNIERKMDLEIVV